MFNTPGPTIDKADRRLKLPDGNVQLGGKTYPVIFPKPLQHGFEWDDNDFQRELYDIVLNDFGHGAFLKVLKPRLPLIVLNSSLSI